MQTDSRVPCHPAGIYRLQARGHMSIFNLLKSYVSLEIVETSMGKLIT